MNEMECVNENKVIMPAEPIKSENRYRAVIKNNYRFFGVATIIFSVFFVFCLYQNSHGITNPIFAAGTIFYFWFSFKKLGIALKRDAVFYIISICLLSVSNFLTADPRIILMNYCGMMMLFGIFMLHHFYDDSRWTLEKYISAGFHILGKVFSVFGSPVMDMVSFIGSKQKRDNRKIGYVILGLLISSPLLIIVLALLSSADVIFGNMAWNFFEKLELIPEDFIGILFTVVFVYLFMYWLLNALASSSIGAEVKNHKNSEPVIAITLTSVLSLIYLLFCGVQIGGLFLGQLKLPEGITYAAYAREGFFQLLLVCLINLVLVLACIHFFQESKLLKMLLTVVSSCTFIMIVSSALRMFLYIREYNLTFLRMFVLWFLVVIFLVMAGVIISIYKDTFPLFRYCMIVVTVLYVALSFSHPDYFIAKYNLEAMKTERLSDTRTRCLSDYGDAYYLSTLSCDAAPALLEIMENETQDKEELQQIIMNFSFHWENTDTSWRQFNVSEYSAKKLTKYYK